MQDAGDFAVVCHTVLQARCPEKGTLTIQEVNDCLDKVAQCNANKDKPGRIVDLEFSQKSLTCNVRSFVMKLTLGLSIRNK